MTSVWDLIFYVTSQAIQACKDLDFFYGISLWDILMLSFGFFFLELILGTIFRHKEDEK